jgi:hypothetical protein
LGRLVVVILTAALAYVQLARREKQSNQLRAARGMIRNLGQQYAAWAVETKVP